MTDDRETLSEAEALRLWQKAAELQAEAARRAEARAAGEADGEPGGDAPRREADGYALVHVRAAAQEAGIGEEFVEAALAEIRSHRAVAAASGTPRRGLSRWVLGNPAEAVVARRDIRATPAAILAAMEEILPYEPYRLTLHDRQGDPARGGVLVFDIQGAGFTSTDKGFTGEASFSDLRQVLATLSARPGDPSFTTVTVSAPVAWAWRINAGLASLFTLLGGGLGLAAGMGLGAGVLVLGPLGAALLTGMAGAGAGVGALGGYRALYRYGLARGQSALEALLATVAAKAEGGWGIAPRDPDGSAGSLPPG
ncbi:MAG: hypothetical protein Q8N53_12580 [Longimicrobiales bacterium]|nr:hypothetical protein [Longimicrobiales bacterium]